MSDVILGQQASTVAYFCPKCSSPSLDIDTGLDPKWRCTNTECNATGKIPELVAAPVAHEFKSDTELLKVMMKDLRKLMAKSVAEPIGRFLLKWGFLDQPVRVSHMARYLSVSAEAIVYAIVNERRAIVEEQHGQRPK